MAIRHTVRTAGRALALTTVLLLAIAAASGSVAAHSGDDGLHHHDGWMGAHDGMGAWAGGGVGFLWLIVWPVLLIGIPAVGGYLLLTRRASGEKTADDALDLLRRRYAQGEIDKEEFEARRTKLLTEQH